MNSLVNELENEFLSKFENFEKRNSLYAEKSNNSFTNHPDFISKIESKLSLVTEKINAQTERNLKGIKVLNVIIFNILESCNSLSIYTIDNAKQDLNIIQSTLGFNKLN